MVRTRNRLPSPERITNGLAAPAGWTTCDSTVGLVCPGEAATELLERLYLAALALGTIAAITLTRSRLVAEWVRIPTAVPTAVAAVATCFGGAGLLVMRLTSLSSRLGLVVAAFFSLLSVATLLGLAYLARRAASQRHAYANVVGAVADVIVPIPPGEAGTVLTTTTHPGLRLVATSGTDRIIGRGVRVVIKRYRHDRAEVAVMRLPANDETGTSEPPATGSS